MISFGERLTSEQLFQMILDVGTDGDKKISLEEFANMSEWVVSAYNRFGEKVCGSLYFVLAPSPSYHHVDMQEWRTGANVSKIRKLWLG